MTVCRVCLAEVAQRGALKLGCACTDNVLHRECAKQWFAQRGVGTCEVCLHALGADALAAVGAGLDRGHLDKACDLLVQLMGGFPLAIAVLCFRKARVSLPPFLCSTQTAVPEARIARALTRQHRDALYVVFAICFLCSALARHIEEAVARGVDMIVVTRGFLSSGYSQVVVVHWPL